MYLTYNRQKLYIILYISYAKISLQIIILSYYFDVKSFKQIISYFLSFVILFHIIFCLRLWLIKLINIKILGNFLKFIKFKNIILFLILITYCPFYLIFNFFLKTSNIKYILNILFFFLINNYR